MRRWRTTVVLVLASVVTPAGAFAEAPEARDAGGVAATTADEPGAEPPPRGGYGDRKGLLGPDHTFTRAIGDFAIAYAPLPSLVLGLSLDGRYDKHKGLG